MYNNLTNLSNLSGTDKQKLSFIQSFSTSSNLDLDIFKSGGTIKIKKKNRGKFTDYCGGTVTQECIQKGKHSSNPLTRRRATFAANARKWKKG